MLIVNVVCRGVTPLLMNRMSESTLENLRTKGKKSKTANVGTTRTPREEASEKVYEVNGRPVVPVANLMSCFIAAGVFSRLDAKRQISTARTTLLPGFMTILSTTIPVTLPDSDAPATWEADVRQGTNLNGGGGSAVAICRPRFDAWSISFRIGIETDEIGENAIRELIDRAGRLIGLGDFRPARKGVFGQFVVEKWEREADVSQAAE